jgi:hypothetical protein
MGTLALTMAGALEWGGLRSPDIADAGPVPFLLPLVAGALASWVATFGAGLVAGMLTGAAYALGGGLVQTVMAGGGAGRSAAAMALMVIIGGALGALAASPIALVRWHRRLRRSQRM